MNKKKKNLVRILAIILALLLGGSAIVSAIFSFAYAEEAPVRNQCELTMEYLEDEQALRISQRLVYINESGLKLDRVLFYAPANVFRREDATAEMSSKSEEEFPAGYLPGGIELMDVQANGQAADYGFQGAAEIYLRVACELAPGESCVFDFDYYLLLTENAAFLGANDKDWRLSGFYFAPAYVDEEYNEFTLSSPLSYTRWMHAPAADYSARIRLPEGYVLSSSGVDSETDGTWTMQAEGLRDFAFSFGKKLREKEEGAIRIAVKSSGAEKKILRYAQEALLACEKWFGPFPRAEMDFVQSGAAADFYSHSGCAWLSEDILRDDDALRRAVYFCISQQYFGMSAYARPGADAWLSDSICEYLSYLILEECEGEAAYLKALNQNIVPALQLTIPGGLNVVSDASLFETASEYDTVVRDRGAAVFHELRTAMGRENLISGLRLFYEDGLEKDVLSEMDLVHALDAASGGSWEAFLTDWVFNIGDYANQRITWLD